MRRCYRVVFLLAFGAMVPASALAQTEAFLQAVRELAQAATAPAPSIDAALARMAAALADWDRSIDAVPRNTPGTEDSPDRIADLRLRLGREYLERGRPADALRELDAIPVTRDRSHVHLLRARALEAMGDELAAARAVVSAFEIDPLDPVKAYGVLQLPGGVAADRARARATLMDVYRRTLSTGSPQPRRFPPSAGVLDTLLPAPVVGDARMAAGFALLAAHRFDAAIATLRARSDEPAAGTTDSPAMHFARGRAHEIANEVAEARREYQAALSGTLIGRGVLLVGIGRLAQVDGDFAGAVAALRSAVRLDPNDVPMRKELANALAASDRPDEAFTELVAALLIDPRDAHAFAVIGQLFLDTDRPADAVSALDRALQLAPARHEVRYALAMALRRLGRTAAAARELETFERAGREVLERRRRQIATQVEGEESLGDRGPGRDPAR